MVGLEFQMASACLPAAWLAAAEGIDGDHLARRFEQRFERRMRTYHRRDRRETRTR